MDLYKMDLYKIDLYKILEIEPTNDINIIKKAYKNLAIKYHPDKNNNVDSSKFIKIHTAYKLLLNQNNNHNEDIFSLFKNYINDDIILFINNIISYYNLSLDDFKDDINNVNIINIINKLKVALSNNKLNIIEHMTVNICDKDKFMIIKVTRKTKDELQCVIPLNDKLIIIDDEGECINNVHGDIILYLYYI